MHGELRPQRADESLPADSHRPQTVARSLPVNVNTGEREIQHAKLNAYTE